MQPRARALLEDIRESIGNIDDDTQGLTFEEFLRDRVTRQVVSYNFLIIGEAVNRLRREDPSIVEQISDYQDIIGFRNVLIHGYDVINHQTLWHAVKTSLPVLRDEVERLLQEPNGG